MPDRPFGSTVYGIGIDVIELARIEDAMSDPGFEERILHPVERRPDYDCAALARRWAIKEAVAKAVGTHLGWHDVQLFEDASSWRVAIRTGAAPEGLHVHVGVSVASGLATACAVAQLIVSSTEGL